MSILVTGFDPFGGEKVNPAWEAVRQLDGELISGERVHALILPTVRGKSLDVLKQGIQKFDPDLILCVGQAGGRPDITVERAALNCDDFRIPDNAGHQPVDEPVVPGGPAAYFSTLPIKRMVQAVRGAGIPASVSNSAGTFVCNHVFYGLMDQLAHDCRKRRGGFLHVPYLPEQAARIPGAPSMARETIVRGLELALVAAVKNTDDISVTGGSIC